jgi:exopolysaccharide biosynthesis polyprenyl glycosylphosphotransferase
MQYYLGNVYLGRALVAIGLDAAAFALAALLAATLAPDAGHGAEVAPIAWAAGLLGIVCLSYADAYGLVVLGDRRRSLRSLLAGLGIGAAVVLAASGVGLVSRHGLVWTARIGVLAAPLLLASRTVLRLLLAHDRFVERVVLVGVSDLSRAIARAVRERRGLGTEVAGFLSDDPAHAEVRFDGYPVLGSVADIEKVLDGTRASRVVVASKRRDEHFPAEALLFAKLHGIDVESGVSFYERVTGRIYMRDLRPSYLIFSKGFTPRWSTTRGKRALDVALSAAGLLAASPVLLMAMLAVRLESRGPVFFGQARIGRGGRSFRLWKLRSMRADAEARTGAVFAARGDPRVTRVGRWLRRTRLDEIPQLWNVLRGDMSLVGPRPERPEFAERLADHYPYFRLRCAVQPGLTGWAQIRHGYVSDFMGWEEKLSLDLYYLKYRSFTMDCLILWETAKTVALLRGE